MFNSDISFLWILSSKRFLKKLKTQLQKGMNIKQLQALSHGHLTSAYTPKLVVLLILSICRRANEWIFCRTDFRWLLLHLVLPSNLKFYRFKHSAFFCVWKCEFMRSLHSVFFHTHFHTTTNIFWNWGCIKGKLHFSDSGSALSEVRLMCLRFDFLKSTSYRHTITKHFTKNTLRKYIHYGYK